MNDAVSAINTDIYRDGKTTHEAIFEFGSAELIEAYELSLQPQNLIKNSSPKGFLDVIQSAAQGVVMLQNNKLNREKLFNSLKNDILEQIKRGDLIAFGFKEPRNLQDKAVKIPADLFISGELNWDNSELKYKGMEFTGIRLFQDLNPVIDLKAENSKTPEKPKFSDLDPELHIDENQAAEYLGISSRTLQGYRVKGGGPEFVKIGKKSVRYKITDLIGWNDGNKKKNTSDY